MTAGSSTITGCPACGARNRVPEAATGSPRCAKCKAALPWLVDADDDTFEAVAVASALPVIVDLWAPWCGPCRVVGPILERLAGEFAGRCKVVKVNVDEAPGPSQRFGVQGVPTLVAMRDGTEVGRQVGAAPEGRLREWIASVAR